MNVYCLPPLFVPSANSDLPALRWCDKPRAQLTPANTVLVPVNLEQNDSRVVSVRLHFPSEAALWNSVGRAAARWMQDGSVMW